MTKAQITAAIEKAISFTALGILGSSLLMVMDFINQWVFALLVVVILFKDSIQELSVGLSGLKFKRQIAAIVAKETEPYQQMQSVGDKLEAYGTDPKTDSVIKAIGSSNYTFRNIEGIIKDTGILLNEVENSLNWLLANKLAIESPGIGGNVYSLSPKGFQVFSTLLNT